MSARRARDVSMGLAFSLGMHALVLLLVEGWLERAVFVFPEHALAVAIWTEPEPPIEPDEPDEDVSARTVETAEPAPAAVEGDALPEPPEDAAGAGSEAAVRPPEAVDEPEEGTAAVETERERVVIPDPPPETARPELPEMGTPEIDTRAPLSPLAGLLETPPAGPGDADRGRIIGERLTASSRGAAERLARLEGRSPAREVAGLDREADTLMVPAGETPLASEKGVVGPLGRRHILYSQMPVYPAWARRLGLEAKVRFRIWVTSEGEVSRVEVLERSGSTELDRHAEEALRAWRFQPLPATPGARDEWGEVPMTFTLVAD